MIIGLFRDSITRKHLKRGLFKSIRKSRRCCQYWKELTVRHILHHLYVHIVVTLHITFRQRSSSEVVRELAIVFYRMRRIFWNRKGRRIYPKSLPFREAMTVAVNGRTVSKQQSPTIIR